MPDMIRIDRFLANNNIGTRKEVSIYIRKGRVEVDSQVIKDSSFKFDSTSAEVKFDGNVILYKKHIYLMMNKPKGLLSATRDKKASTVLDIVPEESMRKDLFPAGRLDKDTTGLLIITDDGETAHKMLAPKSHVYKKYLAKLDKPLTVSDIQEFEKGIKSGDLQFLPAKLVIDENDSTVATVDIREGKFHQIKRMFKAQGKEVLELKRLQIGSLELDPNLNEGECRELSADEIRSIFVEFE